MHYLVHYRDSTGDIDYDKTVEYDGPIESLLADICEMEEESYQRIMKDVSK